MPRQLIAATPKPFYKALKYINYRDRISVKGRWNWNQPATGFKDISSQVADAMG